MITVPNVPNSIEVPGTYGNLDFTRAIQGLLVGQRSTLLIGQMLQAYVTPGRWQGGTLHDMTAQGTYIGSTKLNIVIEIDAADTPDTFKASFDGGVTFPITTEAIVGGAIALTGSNGVTVTFAATTGHAVADQWVFEAYPDPPNAKEDPKSVFAKNDGHELYGNGAVIGHMVASAFTANRNMDLNVVTLIDNGSNFAAGSLQIDIDAINSGTLTVKIANKRFQIAVAKDDLKEDIAIAVQNAIAEDVNIQITIAVDTTDFDQVNWQAKNAGTLGNLLIVTVEAGTTGLTFTEVAMTGGSTDPDISLAVAAIAGSSYYYWVNPYKDSTTVGSLVTEINDRSGAIELRPALLFQAELQDFNTAITLANSTNSGRVGIFAVEGIKSLPYEVSAACTSIISLSSSTNNNFNFSVVPGIDIPEVADRFIFTEKQAMIAGGVIPLVTENEVDLQILSGRSTYLRNLVGNPDTSQKKINITRGADLVRSDIVNISSSLYSQSKVIVQADIELTVFNRLLLLQTAGIVHKVEDNRDLIISAINISNQNRLDFEVPEAIIPDLDIIAFNFLVNSI